MRNLILSAIAIAGVAAALAVWRAPEVEAWLWRARAGAPVMGTFKPVLDPTLHWVDDYYVVADLGAGAFAIGEPKYGQCNFSYLIVGSGRALLFDTGPGLKDIGAVARSLTSLPLEVLPSHLHFDHTGNLQRFDDVALPSLPALRSQARANIMRLGLYQSLGFVEGFGRRPFRVSSWIVPGSQIELGGRRLELVSVPGHTPDSVVLYDRDADRVFAGDFIYPSEIYAFLPGADLASYAASARRVHGMIQDSTKVYGAHGCDRPPRVDVPTLARTDVAALATALGAAAATSGRLGTGWFPRVVPVNERMTLLATYPWMAR